MKLRMQLSPASCHKLSLRFKYLPQPTGIVVSNSAHLHLYQEYSHKNANEMKS